MKSESQRIFLDFWHDPVDSPRRDRPGVYDAHVYGPEGKRLQVILLDTRYFRGPLKRAAPRMGGSYVPQDDPHVTMLGEEQWSWLEQQLRVPAELRIMASSIQCVAEASGQETWSNLPHERQRLFDLIERTRAEGLVIISGDRHWAELSVLEDPRLYPLYDLTSSSFNQIHARGIPTPNKYRGVPQDIPSRKLRRNHDRLGPARSPGLAPSAGRGRRRADRSRHQTQPTEVSRALRRAAENRRPLTP